MSCTADCKSVSLISMFMVEALREDGYGNFHSMQVSSATQKEVSHA